MKTTFRFLALLIAILALTFTTLGPAPVFAAQAKSTQPGSDTSLLQFTSGGHVFGFRSGEFYVTNATYALHVSFVSANSIVPQSASNTAFGTDTAPARERVTYTNLWDGITLEYTAVNDGLVQSSYSVAPGADVNAIRLRYNGAVTINEDGTLTTAFETGTINETAPTAWQEIEGQRVSVAITFQTWDKTLVGFRVGDHDPAYPLFIDPTLTWNTFLGGSDYDYGNDIAVDGSGNVYVAGSSQATWQGTSAPMRAYSGGGGDAFAAKLDPSGGLTWNTFLGGTGNDDGDGIAVDGSGNVYVVGTSYTTWQGSFVPVRAFAGAGDAFVAKLSSNGGLTWNTFLGGSNFDYGNDIEMDGNGNVYVVGTSQTTWQGASAPVRPYAGGSEDAFAAKLNSSGGLTWNTFLGGGGYDRGNDIVVDGSGNVYVTGDSNATWQGASAPVRAYTYGWDAFVAKLDSTGVFTWNTFLGASPTDVGHGIAVDGSGNVYVVGASPTTWQGTSAPVRAFTGGSDAFVAKLDSSGGLTWNAFLGGASSDDGNGIAVDESGDFYVIGDSTAAWQDNSAPVRAYTPDYGDVFVAKLTQDHPTINGGVIGQPGAMSISNMSVHTVHFTSMDVNFDKDVTNSAGDTSPDDVTNPLNYLLLQSGTDSSYQTTSCLTYANHGNLPPGDDVRIPTGPVVYDNHNGAGPFTARVTLNNGIPLPAGEYRLLICGTTSITGLTGDPLNGGVDDIRDFTIIIPVKTLPTTGFVPDQVTVLPQQTVAYSALGDLWLEIPSLNVKSTIVGVPRNQDKSWDVTWLGNDTGWLNGTAFPSWEGNSVLTAHITNANGQPGPFANIKSLKYGDQVIVHISWQQYIFEVRESKLVRPATTDFALQHLEKHSYLTLITCQGYNPLNEMYLFRKVVRAVLVDVK